MKKPIFLAALLCGCLTAASLYAKEGAGFTFDGGKLTVSPVVNMGVFWESNGNNSSHDEDAGAGYHIQPAISFSYAAKRMSFGANTYYTFERGFDSDNGQDSDSYGFSLSGRRELSRRWNLGISASYNHSENDQFTERPSGIPGISFASLYKDESDNYALNASLGYRSERWQFSFGAGWSRTETKGRNNWGSNDSNNYNVSALVGRAIGPSTYWNVSGSMSFDKPSNGETSTSYALMTGISGEVTNKTSYSAMVGVSFYDYSGNQDDTDFGPSYSVSIAHRFSRRITLSAAFDSRYESEQNANPGDYYSWSHNLTAAMNFQISDPLSARLSSTFSYEDHTAPAGGSYDRTYFQTAASLYYAFNSYVSLYTTASWRTDIADGAGYRDDDRDDIRLDAGLSFRF